MDGNIDYSALNIQFVLLCAPQILLSFCFTINCPAGSSSGACRTYLDASAAHAGNAAFGPWWRLLGMAFTGHCSARGSPGPRSSHRDSGGGTTPHSLWGVSLNLHLTRRAARSSSFPKSPGPPPAIAVLLINAPRSDGGRDGMLGDRVNPAITVPVRSEYPSSPAWSS